MEHSPEIRRVLGISSAILFALGSLSLASHEMPETHNDAVVVAALPPTTVTLPETTTTLAPTTTLPERVVRPRAARAEPAPRPAVPPTAPPAPPPIDSVKVAWMAEGGIPEANYDEADYIFTKESGWRPEAENHKGCIGIGQNCPDKKTGERWLEQACPDWRTNIICQIRRFQIYAIGRYRSWEEAMAHKKRYGWW